MYLSEGQYSTIADPDLDVVLKKAMAATGDEREKLFQEVFAKVHDEIVQTCRCTTDRLCPCRLAPRLEAGPKTNSEIALSEIHFKD